MARTRSASKQAAALTPRPVRLLIVEHDSSDVELCLQELKRAGVDARADVVATAAEFEERLRDGEYDAVLADYRLPGWGGPEALSHLRSRGLDLPFILVTGTIGEERVVEVMKQGATDYVLKDHIPRLPMVLRRALAERASQAAQRTAEDALARSELRYRSLVENTSYGVYLATPTGAFEAVNPALIRMLGYDSEAELLGRNIDRDIYADPRARQRLLARYGQSDRIVGLEVEWKRKDGTPLLVRLAGRPVMGQDDRVTGYEMFAEDVTARVDMEERLRQVQKMEAMGELTGGIAHDFNNLLTIITTNAELIEHELPPALADIRMELAELKAAARRGSAMVRKLLTFGRKAALEVERLDLGVAVRETATMLRRFLPETIEVQVSVPGDPVPVMADLSAVEQILINLATNARDAMPDGGQLSIEVQRVTLDDTYLAAVGASLAAGEYARARVTDTGMGMDPRTRERIFEPFFTTKPPSQGTGLGMAMVYGLVREHGGFVNVYSEVGRGTSIKIYLPVTTVEAAQPAAVQGGPAGGSECILVVEDEEMIRSSTRRILERYGYRVLLAANGDEALARLRTGESVDLVLSDVVMPRMSGRQLLETLRREGYPVKFIFTSGYTALDPREDATLDPSIPFLAKPWAAVELAQRVRAVLDGA